MATQQELFQQKVISWRQILASLSSVDDRIQIFERAADDIGAYVARGCNKITATDELRQLATAYGLFAEFDENDVQAIIADAIERGSRFRVVSDSGEPTEQINGKPSALKILSKAEFVQGFIPPNYLIDGMLQRRFIYALTGQTGHAKTAIALLIASLVGSPDPNTLLGLHKVEKGRAVYFVGENPDDLRMRVIGADSLRNDNPLIDNVFYIPGVFNIAQMYMQISAVLQSVGGADLIIIDTSAAYFLGNEELNNTQMGNHARMLRRLTELPGGPCVLVLCHPIKYVTEAYQLLPRGGGAFLAEMDGNLTVVRHDDTLIELHHNKIRGPGFEPMCFRLDRITTPKLVDSKDRMIPTVGAVSIGRTDETDQQKRNRNDEDIVLASLLKDPELSFAEIAEQAGWFFGSGEPAKSRVQRIIDRIHKESKPQLLRKNRQRWELTEEGKNVARRAALELQKQAELADEARNQSTFDL